MSIIGIIGGIGPASTIDYYQKIISSYRKQIAPDQYPLVLINSINLTECLDYMNAGKYHLLADYLVKEIGRLEVAGAQVVAMASNTPHIIFDEIAHRVKLPMVSIVEETCRVAQDKGFSRVGLFGTQYTMEGGFYQKVGDKYQLEVITPSPDERAYIHKKYFDELVPGIFQAQTRKELEKIAREMMAIHKIEALILGGTELPLILSGQDISGLPLLNTTQLHVQKLIDFIRD